MHTIGTAGHVDHGKSALVIALTGHDPDRLIEERRRGMTLDLGFAPLSFDDGVRAGIIDVPGHERFLHNMLAGAAGMELLLLVIAATEGPREQTREHLQVLGFLNVRKTLIVLTKADLVDAAGRDAALELTRTECRGTVADGAPAFFVSNLTGEGIPALRDAIHDAIADLPPRSPDAPSYLPIDRIFSLAGHGTIVTGTLMQGTIAIGDALRLQPSGCDVRVRSLHVFGESVPTVSGGARAAVNVTGVELGEIARGETLVAPREFTPTREVAIAFTPLASALPLLRRRTLIRAHIGSAEIPGVLVFEGRPPAEVVSTRARLMLRTPVAVCSGSRLVLRRMSPKELLGGGVVEPLEIRVRVRPLGAEPLSPLAAEIVAALEAAGVAPLAADSIAAALNVRVADVDVALVELSRRDLVTALKKPPEYLSRSASAAAFDAVMRSLRERHARAPWTAGCTSAEIAKETGSAEPLIARLLAHWHALGAIAKAAKYWCEPGFALTLTEQQRAALDAALQQTDANPLVPAAYDAVRDAIHASRVPGLTDAFDGLIALGAFIRIGDDLYRKSQVDDARAILVRLLQSTGGATLAAVRNEFGTSRRYALPLVEHFDGLGLTLRDGDLRRLRAVPPAG